MKSNLITKSQSNVILEQIKREWKLDIPKIKNLKEHQITDDSKLISGKEFMALVIDGRYIPFLSDKGSLVRFPSVTVDSGAIKFMCNGADVMRPGIKENTEFDKDEIVCVKEESHGKFLAVGLSIISSEEMKVMSKGRVLRNIHHISDQYWESAKSLVNI